ncbi:MAG TPA: hypothetical protein DCY95_20500, partial [Algoriphagus sp.]|nr:hypothetical protein [Algoriphagus sp.]
LRSQEWYGRTGKDGFIYRSWMKNQGLPHHLFEGEKPVIGICNTWSEFTPCNAHFRDRLSGLRNFSEDIKNWKQFPAGKDGR